MLDTMGTSQSHLWILRSPYSRKMCHFSYTNEASLLLSYIALQAGNCNCNQNFFEYGRGDIERDETLLTPTKMFSSQFSDKSVVIAIRPLVLEILVGELSNGA